MRRHIYEGERCVFCNVNTYDDSIYGPFECADREEPFIYTTQTGDPSVFDAFPKGEEI